MSDPLVWEPAFATGDAASDRRRHALIARCNALAEHCGPSDAEAAAFETGYAAFKVQVRAHLAAEADRLAADADALEVSRGEHDHFDALVDEVATTANFERAELQGFVAVWLLGHLREGAALSASTSATAAARTASPPGP